MNPQDEDEQFLPVGDYKAEDFTSQHTAGVDGVVSSDDKSVVNAVIASDPIPVLAAENRSSHPVASAFHVGFKAVALVMYLFGLWFTDNFVFIFVLTVLSLAADFWAVKNVTGRLLVGLRWWNEVKEDGSTEWRFESKPPNSAKNKADENLFWMSLYITPLIWILLAIADLVKLNLKWLPLTAVAVVLNCAQFAGYWKCNREAQAQLASMFRSGVAQVSSTLVQQQVEKAVDQQFSKLQSVA